MMSRFVSVAVVVAAAIILAGVLVAPVSLASHVDREDRRTEEPRCSCSASLSYVRPELEFGASGLVFSPRVNVKIRLRGDANGPKHTVGVRYSGQAQYTSDQVTVPDGVIFGGEKTLISNASCEGRWSFDGMELARVALPGLERTVVGKRQKLMGTVRMDAAVTGCSGQVQDRQFLFTLRDLGRLSIGSWRSPR